MRVARPATILVLAAAMATATAVAGQPVLYGVAYNGANGPATLYTIDATTGTATAVGPIGFLRCGGIDFDSSGVLYGTCERDNGDESTTPVLVTIDLTTGAGTEVGETGFFDGVTDISFRNSDGVLYAYTPTAEPLNLLFTVSTSDGSSTLVGDTGFSEESGNGMTFDLADTLFHSAGQGGANVELDTLDQTDGSHTMVGILTPSPSPMNSARLNAMDVHPVSGVMYAIYNDSGEGGPRNFLAIVDVDALTVTSVGPTQGGMDAIAWSPAPRPSVLEVPTLAPVGLVLLAVVLAGIAILLLRRRRPSATALRR